MTYRIKDLLTEDRDVSIFNRGVTGVSDRLDSSTAVGAVSKSSTCGDEISTFGILCSSISGF